MKGGMTVNGPVGLESEGRGTGLTLQMAHPAAGAVQGNGLVGYSTKRVMIELTNRALEVLSSDLKRYGVIVLCRRDCCIAELRTREACESGEWRRCLGIVG